MRTKPSFTARDFVFIAVLLRNARQALMMSRTQHDRLVAHFADALTTTNLSYDRERFVAASTPEVIHR